MDWVSQALTALNAIFTIWRAHQEANKLAKHEQLGALQHAQKSKQSLDQLTARIAAYDRKLTNPKLRPKALDRWKHRPGTSN